MSATQKEAFDSKNRQKALIKDSVDAASLVYNRLFNTQSRDTHKVDSRFMKSMH